ncbi:MAG: CIA30 family protein, partial [Bacteroidota bacterium]
MKTLLIFLMLTTSCMSATKKTATPPTENDATTASEIILYDFVEQGKGKWSVQDDVVMGGRSDSQLDMIADNYARFAGRVSLENNGGFCSMRQVVSAEPYVISSASSAFVLTVKGDGEDYRFRVRTPNGQHSYGYTFSTQAGEWETITIPFDEMSADYRGRKVNVPNYAGEAVVELR